MASMARRWRVVARTFSHRFTVAPSPSARRAAATRVAITVAAPAALAEALGSRAAPPSQAVVAMLFLRLLTACPEMVAAAWLLPALAATQDQAVVMPEAGAATAVTATVAATAGQRTFSHHYLIARPMQA